MASKRRRKKRRQSKAEGIGHQAAFVLLVCVLALAALAVMVSVAAHP